jgi:hypothetical protein
MATRDVFVDADSTLAFQANGADPFKRRVGETFTVLTSRGDRGLDGNFELAEGQDSYFTVREFSWGLMVKVDADLHPGDANLDGKTNIRDFNSWNASKFTEGAGWAGGDFNGDGKTNVVDFNIWNENKFTSVGAARLVEGQVPEPGTLILLAVGLMALLLRRIRAA